MGETDRAGPADPRPGPPRVSPHPPHNRPSGQRAETQPARPWPTQRHAQQQPSTPLPGRQTVHSRHTKVEEADKITLSYKLRMRYISYMSPGRTSVTGPGKPASAAW